LKLLERGASGSTIDQMLSDMEFEAVSIQVLKASLGTLMKEGLVSEAAPGVYAVASAVKKPPGRTYEVVIEEIYPGVAVVRVNDKWRARLDPYDYNGPRSPIKKNSRFRAVAELYRMDGKLCIRIKEVTQTLN